MKQVKVKKNLLQQNVYNTNDNNCDSVVTIINNSNTTDQENK